MDQNHFDHFLDEFYAIDKFSRLKQLFNLHLQLSSVFLTSILHTRHTKTSKSDSRPLICHLINGFKI